MRAASLLCSSLFCLSLGACVPAEPPELRTLVTVVSTEDGEPAAEATARLATFGKPALVVIEAALHTADAPGRKRLIAVIERIGDPDARALLEHFARYDEDASVRAAAARVAAGLARR